MDIVNFWVAYNDNYMMTQVESFLPTLPVLAGHIRTHQEPSESTQAGIFTESVGWRLRSLYRPIDELNDVVQLREDLRWLRSTYPTKFYCAGMWSYNTGEPIGGVGSPWFRTLDAVSVFLPSDEVDDTVLLAGQANRKFI